MAMFFIQQSDVVVETLLFFSFVVIVQTAKILFILDLVTPVICAYKINQV